MTTGRMLLVLGGLVVSAIPLALSVWAVLDAAHRPEWAFAWLGRNRLHWVAACAAGVLFCGPGLIVSGWYLLKIRPQVAAVEAGRLE